MKNEINPCGNILWIEFNKSKRMCMLDVFEDKEKAYQKKYYDDFLNKDIAELDISVRAYNALKKIDIYTIRDLIEFPTDELIRRRSIGVKTLEEIKEKIRYVKNKMG